MSLGRLMELEDRVFQLEVAVARLVDRLDRAKFPEYEDVPEKPEVVALPSIAHPERLIAEAVTAFYSLGVDPESIQAWLNGKPANEALDPYIRGCPSCGSKVRSVRSEPCGEAFHADPWHRWE